MDNCAVECLAVRQTLAFTFLGHYRSGVSQVKTSSVGLFSHLCHTDWSNAADGTGTALVSASGSQIGGIGPSASENRGKMLGWKKRCYFLGLPFRGCLETPHLQFQQLCCSRLPVKGGYDATEHSL